MPQEGKTRKLVASLFSLAAASWRKHGAQGPVIPKPKINACLRMKLPLARLRRSVIIGGVLHDMGPLLDEWSEDEEHHPDADTRKTDHLEHPH